MQFLIAIRNIQDVYDHEFLQERKRKRASSFQTCFEFRSIFLLIYQKSMFSFLTLRWTI